MANNKLAKGTFKKKLTFCPLVARGPGLFQIFDESFQLFSGISTHNVMSNYVNYESLPRYLDILDRLDHSEDELQSGTSLFQDIT